MCSDYRLFSLHTNHDGDIFFLSALAILSVMDSTYTYTQIHECRFYKGLPTAIITLKIMLNPSRMVRLGQAERRRTKEVGGRRRREGINNISAQLILFPLSIKSFFHASIGIPVGHFTASLAGHFACNQNGTLSLWSIHCSPDSIKLCHRRKKKSPC